MKTLILASFLALGGCAARVEPSVTNTEPDSSACSLSPEAWKSPDGYDYGTRPQTVLGEEFGTTVGYYVPAPCNASMCVLTAKCVTEHNLCQFNAAGSIVSIETDSNGVVSKVTCNPN